MGIVTDEQLERELDEIKKLCAPLVEYLHKKWHPHARIIVELQSNSAYHFQFLISHCYISINWLDKSNEVTIWNNR